MLKTDLNEWACQRLKRWRDSGDADALGELLRWQRDRAYAVALRVVGRPEDAEDAVQQAFIKLLSRTRGFEDAEAFRLAVYRAVVQCSLDAIRSNRARAEREKAMSPSDATGVPDPRVLAERAEMFSAVQEELSRVSVDERTAVVLCCQEGLSVTSAAEVMDLNRETLRDRLQRVLKDIRARLKGRGRALSLVALVSVLQSSGRVEAAPAFCAAIDASLPGATCANVPVAAVPSIAPSAMLASAGIAASTIKIASLAAAAIVASTAIALIVGAVVVRANRAEPLHANSRPDWRAIPVDTNKQSNPQEEESPVKNRKIAATILGTALVVGGAVATDVAHAGDADAAKVEQVIAKIKAHRAKKSQERAAAQKNRRKASYQVGGQPGAVWVEGGDENGRVKVQLGGQNGAQGQNPSGNGRR